MSTGSIAAASQRICRNAFIAGKVVTHNRYLAGNFSTAPFNRQVGEIGANNLVLTPDSEAIMGNMSNPYIEIGGHTYYIRQWGISNADVALVLSELDNTLSNTALSATSIAGVTTSLGTYAVGDRSNFLTAAQSGTTPASARWVWSLGTNGIITNISGSHNSSTQASGKAAHFHDFLRINF